LPTSLGVIYQCRPAEKYKSSAFNAMSNWHAPCKHPGIGGRMVRTPPTKGHIMSLRFASAQRFAVSFVGALFFATLAVSAAVPVLPIA
jgi:hypothetical protein